VEEPVPIQEEDTAPKRIRMDVKPLQEEHLQNSFLEEEPEVEVSHPMWRDGLPQDGGFIYWDLLATLFLLVACTGFLLLDPLKRPVYLTIFFLLGYALVVLLYPAPGRLALAKRVGATILLGLLVLGVSYLLWIWLLGLPPTLLHLGHLHPGGFTGGWLPAQVRLPGGGSIGRRHPS